MENLRSLFAVANREHASSRTGGYWGAPDALHQFCEPHYATTRYVAEFWNTISSFVYPLVSVYFVLRMPTVDRPVLVIAALLGAIGLGSAAFHATMRYQLELCDELPMLFFVAAASFAKAAAHPWLRAPSRLFAFRALLVAAHAAATLAYLRLHSYELFIHAFTLLVVLDFAMVWTWGACAPLTRTCANLSLASILVGKLLWEVENRGCAVAPAVWPLHVAWHLASCLSAYWGMVTVALRRLEWGLRGGGEPLKIRWALVPGGVAARPPPRGAAPTPPPRPRLVRAPRSGTYHGEKSARNGGKARVGDADEVIEDAARPSKSAQSGSAATARRRRRAASPRSATPPSRSRAATPA